MSGVRSIAIAIIFVIAAGCGPSERPKLNIKRGPQFEPLPVPEAKEIYVDPTATTGTEVTIVEIDTFKAACDHSFSGINADDLVSLANPRGMKSYRLAGVSIPPGLQQEAHTQVRTWLEGDTIGIELEGGSPGGDPGVYVYRCTARSMLNADLARAGLAVVVDGPSLHRDVLNRASMEALTARRGVWGMKSK